jgi:hypothetical protein
MVDANRVELSELALVVSIGHENRWSGFKELLDHGKGSSERELIIEP